MSKPTPRPWTVESGGFVGGPVGFGRVCQLWNKYEEDFQNAEANAHIIAAAPDLLEACKNMLAELQSDSIEHDDILRITDGLRIIIQKAEGVA